MAVNGELDLKLDIFFWHGLEVNYCVMVKYFFPVLVVLVVLYFCSYSLLQYETCYFDTCSQIRICVQLDAVLNLKIHSSQSSDRVKN